MITTLINEIYTKSKTENFNDKSSKINFLKLENSLPKTRGGFFIDLQRII